MIRLTFKKLARWMGAAVCCASLSACAAKEIPADWKHECVGRMELSLPGEADVAATPKEFFQKQFGILKADNIPGFAFEDMQIAGYSHLYGIAISHVSHTLDAQTISSLRRGFWKDRGEIAMSLKKDADPEVHTRETATVQTGMPNADASRTEEQISAMIALGSHLVLTGARVTDATLSHLQKIAKSQLLLKTRLNAMSSRDFYSLPSEQGICLPYTFIKDDGTPYRNIGMTYRLKSHPDVTIWLEDSSAAEYDDPIREKNAQPAARHNDFWGQYGRGDRQVDTIWKLPAVRPVTLDGREGLASFVEITHREQPARESAFGPKSKYRPKSTDYGYLAVVRGDPKAKQDTPDLRLYVIREAAHAKAKGIEPINEKAFLEMAQTIAASVKHRVGEK